MDFALAALGLSPSLASLRSGELMALRATGGAGSPFAVPFARQPGGAASGGIRRPAGWGFSCD